MPKDELDDFEILTREPALFIRKEKLLVIGDLHIGREQKLAEQGMFFENFGKTTGRRIAELYGMKKAKGAVLLGDVKDSITYPSKEEHDELLAFFYELRELHVMIAMGNHDAHLKEIIDRSGYGIKTAREILIGRYAFMHGNALPSEEAMRKGYMIIAHGHIAAEEHGEKRKIFLVAKIGRGAESQYENFNKSIKLVVVPAFSSTIIGSEISGETKSHIPVFRKNIFDFNSAKIMRMFKYA